MPQSVSPDAPVRWGILGTGAINRKLLAGARLSDAVQVVAVASRTQARADSFAAEHAIPHAVGSYEDLLADPGIEAVYISLPNALHHPWTMAALASGKHVLAEKPYSSRPDEVQLAFDAAEAAGLVLSEALMWRHHPQVAQLQAIAAELGPLQVIRASFCFAQEGAADVRLQPELDGGSLLDVGTYCVSGARLLSGEEPAEVYGVATEGPSGVDVRFTGILRFPGGVVAEFTCGFTTEHRGLEAIGTRGSVLATDPWQSMPAAIVRDGMPVDVAVADPYQLEIEDVSAAIRTGRAPLVGRAESMGQVRALAALGRSAATGAPVRL
jgi:D-xylose 1-dehydrogenase (NADP+, D-xylono-1,5-lactone-forming)